MVTGSGACSTIVPANWKGEMEMEIVIRFRDGDRIDRIAGDSNYRSG